MKTCEPDKEEKIGDSLKILDLKQTYPFITNMMLFAKKYGFDMEDCFMPADKQKNINTPRFCQYGGIKSVYMTRDIMDSLAETKEKKQELVDYIIETFDKPMDSDIISKEKYESNSAQENTSILINHAISSSA